MLAKSQKLVKVQDGIRPCRLEFWEIHNYELCLCLQTSKFNKSAGWNKGVQVGKFLKFNKVCCTIIRETKVLTSGTKAQ